jgi:hypothetical protein
MKVKFFGRIKVGIDMDYDRQVEVYIDTITFEPKKPGSIRIIVLEEPLDDLNLKSYVTSYKHLYDHVFTFREEILTTNEKAVFFRCAEVWSKGYCPTLADKRFAVSTVVGGKYDARMTGYALRHQVWREQDRITIPKEFYLSDSFKWKEADYEANADRVLYGSKDKMFDCMFHIAIENTSIKNYYSEKLLDCFESMTVPIYYGCINLEKYFNPSGVIQVKNIEEIISACNSLTPEKYLDMLPYMEDNKKRIEGRKNYDGQLEDKLKEVLKIQ